MTLPRKSLKRKRAKYPSAAQLEERRAWADGRIKCWICGKWGFDVQTHEVASRAQAPNRWADVRNYFCACAFCNCHVLNHLPESLQLAYKRHFDIENYDRVFVNRIRGRADDAISEGEVRAWKDFVTAIT